MSVTVAHSASHMLTICPRARCKEALEVLRKFVDRTFAEIVPTERAAFAIDTCGMIPRVAGWNVSNVRAIRGILMCCQLLVTSVIDPGEESYGKSMLYVEECASGKK